MHAMQDLASAWVREEMNFHAVMATFSNFRRPLQTKRLRPPAQLERMAVTWPQIMIFITAATEDATLALFTHCEH